MIFSTLNKLHLGVKQVITNTKSITIIKYHSISNTSDPYNISPNAFSKQTEFISKHYNVARLRHLKDILAVNNDTNQRMVIITFDDAYTDFFDIAYPILDNLSMPSTLFIPSGFIGKSNEWDIPLANYIKRPIMTSRQLHNLKRDGLVDFGSHSVSHQSMSDLSINEMRKQAIESKNTLENLFSCPITMFCYPFGHFSKITSRVLLEANYKIAVTSKWGTLNSNRNLLNLKIVYLSEEDSCSDIRDKIEGLHDIYYIKGLGYIKRLGFKPF